MTIIKFVSFNEIVKGKYYKLIKFTQGVRISEIEIGKIDDKRITEVKNLGKLINILTYGRPYDLDVLFYFEQENGNKIEYEPAFGMQEAFIEYEPDTEEKSKQRIQERVNELKLEIISNDWALRPENVIATQGIDLFYYNK
jgi:hypothetical protein